MPKIMLVEDDNNLREIYGERLMAEGYDIVSANDGEEALALAVKEKPDLIVSDVMMPKISGFDMLDILRQTPETKNTKVVMMTALSQTEDKERADRLGADKYLVKSQVTLEDVARVVHDLLYGDAKTPEQAAPPDSPGSVTPTASEQNGTATQTPILEQPAIVSPPVADTPEVPETPVAPPTPVASEPIIIPTAPEPPQPVQPPIAPVAQTPDEPATDDTQDGTVASNNASPAPPAAKPFDDLFNESKIKDFTDSNEPQGQPINPITGSPVGPELSHTNSTTSATAISSSEEGDGIAQQIADFATEAAPSAETSDPTAPLVEPTEQELIHAKNSADEPEVSQPAIVGGMVGNTGPDVPPVRSSQDGAIEPASARKKVIQPPSDLTDSEPDINQLYEAEMRKEAADTPVVNPDAGSVLDAKKDSTNNPITNGAGVGPAPLETIDATQIAGVTIAGNESEIPGPTPKPAEPQPTAEEPSENSGPDPNQIAL